MPSFFRDLFGILVPRPRRRSQKMPPREADVKTAPKPAPIPAPFISVPLYIYPSPGAWDPLLHAIQTHPSLHFLLVVNPNSGPGPESLPDANYRAAVGSLSQFPNVHILGYVPIHYSSREPRAVKADIDLYRGWNDSAEPKLRMDGIFFDEVASNPATAVEIARLSQYVREVWRAGSGTTGYVMYNPGVPVEDVFFADADYVVVFEESEQRLAEFSETIRGNKATQAGRTTALLHSFRGTGSDLEAALGKLLDLGCAGVYATDQRGGGYNQWPASWEEQAGWLAAKRGESGES